MHQGSCHCGAVKLKLPSTPTEATSCNCSLCRRIGGPWVYFEFGTVEIDRTDFHRLLEAALKVPGDFLKLPKDTTGAGALEIIQGHHSRGRQAPM